MVTLLGVWLTGTLTLIFSSPIFFFFQKYGYELPDIKSSPDKDMLLERKDPRQIFYGLEPGWVVNMKDKVIVKPTDPVLKEFYAS